MSDVAPDDGNSPMQVVAPARVANVSVNDGSAQRSIVNSLTVNSTGRWRSTGNNTNRVVLSARGQAVQTTTDLAIAGLSVHGRVEIG